MQQIPETRQALGRMRGPAADNIERLLDDLSHQVRAIVPDCVGLSLASLDGDEKLTFTVAASSVEMAMFDALQYLDGGPCEEAMATGQQIRTDDLHEEQWRLLAEATATTGVRSTLSFPIWEGGRVVGGVNLYGASAHAFVGSEEALGALVGSSTREAVSNADLSFSTRVEARKTAERLEDRATISDAVDVLAERNNEDADTARRRFVAAAARAGLSPTRLALLILDGRAR